MCSLLAPNASGARNSFQPSAYVFPDGDRSTVDAGGVGPAKLPASGFHGTSFQDKLECDNMYVMSCCQAASA